MVDSIILEVHDLELHKDIVKQLHTNKTKHIKKGLVYLSDSFNLENNGHKLLSEFFHNGSLPLQLFNGKITPKSSHRNIDYSVNVRDDVIRFNFSIPKLIYGHNVAEFVSTHLDTNFTFINNFKILDQKKFLYNNLIKVIKNFFVLYFNINQEYVDSYGQTKIINFLDWSKVQVKRLDLCFNLYHNNKEDALKHLDLLERVKKKNTRIKHSSKKAVFETGLTHQSDLFYFKIYHKGTEFRKNDYKALKKINAQKGNIYDVDLLQSIADKILRFELEFKSSTLNYIHKQKIFRKDCLFHKKDKQIYNEIRQKSRMSYLKIHKLYKQYNLKYDSKLSVIKTAHDLKIDLNRTAFIIKNNLKKQSGEEDLTLLIKSDKLFFKNYSTMIDKSTNFYLKSVDHQSYHYHNHKIHNDYYNDYEYQKSYVFNKDLLNASIDKFYEVLKNFKIEKIPSTIRLQENLKNFNERKKKKKVSKHLEKYFINTASIDSKLQVNRMNSVILLLESGYTLDDIRFKMDIPKSTFYRLKADLKKIGYESNMQNFTIPIGEFDFKRYLSVVRTYPYLFRQK